MTWREMCYRCGKIKQRTAHCWCPACYRRVTEDMRRRIDIPPGCKSDLPSSLDRPRNNDNVVDLEKVSYREAWEQICEAAKKVRCKGNGIIPLEDMGPWQEKALRDWEDG